MAARMIRMMTVDALAARYRPPPTASPTAATVQMLAAVVSPLTISPRARIAPAPRNPIPETTWAAIRDGSSTTFFSFRMLENPYWETIMIRQEPTQTSMWVRIPAAHSRRSRSKPMRLPSAAAVTRRSSISILDIVISGVGSLQDREGTIMEFYNWGKVAPHCSLSGSPWSNWYARCNAGIAGFQHISRCLGSVLLYDKWLQSSRVP